MKRLIEKLDRLIAIEEGNKKTLMEIKEFNIPEIEKRLQQANKKISDVGVSSEKLFSEIIELQTKISDISKKIKE